MPLPHHKGLGPGAQGRTAPEEMHHNPSLCFCVFCPEGDFEGAGMSLQVTRHPSLSVIVLSPLETTAGASHHSASHGGRASPLSPSPESRNRT